VLNATGNRSREFWACSKRWPFSELPAHWAKEADEVISLHAPERLRSVGEHYADFAQTTDEEVIRLLGASAPPDALPSTPFEP